MKKITYITGNRLKIESAKYALEPLGFEVDNQKLEIPEIQADDVSEVAMYSAKMAAEELQVPVMTSDLGLFIKSLKGFPGVYTKYVYYTIGIDGLLRLMAGTEERLAYFKEVIAYCEPGSEPVSFEAYTYGTIGLNRSLSRDKNWDYVFIPKGASTFLSDIPKEDKWLYWSVDGYTKLADYLEKQKSI